MAHWSHHFPSVRVAGVRLQARWQWPLAVALGAVLVGEVLLPPWAPGLSTGVRLAAGLLVVLAMEASLLAHELAHAITARGAGQNVRGIVFLGLAAQTVVDHDAVSPAADARTALVGPLANLALAAAFGATWGLLAASHPLSVLAALLALGNVASAFFSLVPLPGSDGARVLGGLRAARAPAVLVVE